jgi:hypothetical protein
LNALRNFTQIGPVMHDFIIAAAIAAFAVFCLIAALAPIIMHKGRNGYEDLFDDHRDR